MNINLSYCTKIVKFYKIKVWEYMKKSSIF